MSAETEGIRERLEAALDVSIDRCARCKVCDTQIGAAMTVLGPLLERAEAAEAQLAEIREVITTYFTVHGNSTAASLTKARDLAEAVRQVLDRVPMGTQERSDDKGAGRG